MLSFALSLEDGQEDSDAMHDAPTGSRPRTHSHTDRSSSCTSPFGDDPGVVVYKVHCTRSAQEAWRQRLSTAVACETSVGTPIASMPKSASAVTDTSSGGRLHIGEHDPHSGKAQMPFAVA